MPASLPLELAIISIKVDTLERDSSHSPIHDSINYVHILKLKNEHEYTSEELILAKELLLAVDNGDNTSAEQLILKGADVNLICQKNYDPFNLLALAIKTNNFKMFQLLLERGAKPNNIFGAENKTALMYAIEKNKINFVRELIQHKININYQDIHGWSALTYASKKSFEIVELLIQNGAEVNLLKYNTILFITPLAHAISNNKINIAQYLVQMGADVNATDRFGNTSLLEAAKVSCLELIKILMQYGAEINALNNSGENALYWAILKSIRLNTNEVNKELLKYGAKVNINFILENKETINLIKDSEFADLLWANSKCNFSKVAIYDQELFASRYVNKIIQNEFGIDCSARIDALNNNNTINDEIKNKIIVELGNLKQAQKDFNMECASIFAQSFVYIKNIDNNSDAKSEIAEIFKGIDSLSPVPLFKIINLWVKDKSYISPENSLEIPENIIELLKFYEQNSAFNYEQAIDILSSEIINNDDLRILQQNITNANIEILQKHFAKLIPILDLNIVEYFLSFTMPTSLEAEFIKAHNKFKNDQETLQREEQETAQKLETSIDENSEQQQEELPKIIKEFISNAFEVLPDIVKDVCALGDNDGNEN